MEIFLITSTVISSFYFLSLFFFIAGKELLKTLMIKYRRQRKRRAKIKERLDLGTLVRGRTFSWKRKMLDSDFVETRQNEADRN